MTDRIILAYSGGLDASAAIPWLAGKYGAEIVAVTMDLGQGMELEAVRDRALAAGAVRAHVLDVREEFAREHVLRALKADATYENRDPLGAALALPLIARKLVEIAAIEQAGIIAYGAHAGTGTGSDPRRSNIEGRLDIQARLELMTRALNPAITVLAPTHEWGMTRPEALDFARTRGLPMPAAVESPYSVEATLWGRSLDGAPLQDQWTDPPEQIYTLTKPAEECPGEAAYVEITFERGVPTAINGVVMPLVELIASLGTIAGAHGVGRGITSREVYEAPAAVVLHAAHQELQGMVSRADVESFSRLVSLQYSEVVYSGLWFTPLREALDAYVDKIQERVTGVVRLKLFKGNCRVAGRKSPFAGSELAQPAHHPGDAFNPGAAAGFIKIVGLPSKTVARKA